MFPDQSHVAGRCSVIIPTYNRAELLPHTIESVLAQTYSDVEIIVVDDGSTDGTRAALLPYSSRITYIYQDNRGRSAARNVGIEHAQGQYLAFLDSDDLFLPIKLKCQVAYLQKHPEVDLVYGDGYVMDEAGVLSSLGRFLTRTDGADRLAFLRRLLRSNLFPPNTALVRRSALDSARPFDEAMGALEDWDLWIRLALRGCTLQFDDRKVAIYRRHSGNTDIARPRNFVRDKVLISSKVIRMDLDSGCPVRLRQLFRIWHLDAILLSRSPQVVGRAISTILFAGGEPSTFGAMALAFRLLSLPVRACEVLGIFLRAFAQRLEWKPAFARRRDKPCDPFPARNNSSSVSPGAFPQCDESPPLPRAGEGPGG
jgi:GT2 family glycosyltransferase